MPPFGLKWAARSAPLSSNQRKDALAFQAAAFTPAVKNFIKINYL
jgi:hypothetical protein